MINEPLGYVWKRHMDVAELRNLKDRLIGAERDRDNLLAALNKSRRALGVAMHTLREADKVAESAISKIEESS